MATDRAKKISDLTTLAANAVANGDLFVVVDVSASETKKVLANNMAQYFIGLVNKGEKGELGTTGTKGDKGSKGDQGDKGDTGNTGSTGSTGAKGEKGERYISATYTDANNTLEFGSSDASSNVYVTGVKGNKGDIGSKGEVGSKGDKGEIGVQGTKGDTGSNATGNIAFRSDATDAVILGAANSTFVNIISSNGVQLQYHSNTSVSSSNTISTNKFVVLQSAVATELYDGSGNLLAIHTVTANGVAFGANNNIWDFGANGTLTFPNGMLQRSAYKGSVVLAETVTSNTFTANVNPYSADVLLVDLSAVGSNCTLTLPFTGATAGKYYTVKIITNSGHILEVTTDSGGNDLEDPSTGTFVNTYSMSTLGQSHTWFADQGGVYRHIV